MVAALVVWLAYAPVEVLGSGDCPAPAEVSRRLTEMLPADGGGPPGQPARHSARVGRIGDAVVVELLLPSGQVIARRDLVASGGCDDLAAALAVVIAAWEAELDPHLTARVELPAPPPRPPARMQLVDAPEGPARTPSFQIGLAVLGSVVGGQLAAGASLEGWLAPPDWHLGLALELSGTTARSEAVGARADAASWTRFALGLGPEAHLGLRGATVDLRAQALVALLHVEGVGLSTTNSDSSAELGAGAGVHVGWPWGNAVPWIGVDILLWPGHESLVVGGLPAVGDLPRFELQVSLGISLGRFP